MVLNKGPLTIKTMLSETLVWCHHDRRVKCGVIGQKLKGRLFFYRFVRRLKISERDC